MDPTLLVLCETLASQHLNMSIHAKVNPFTYRITDFGPVEPSTQHFTYNNGAHLWTLNVYQTLRYLPCR